MTVRLTARLVVRLDSEAVAKRVRDALDVDSEGYTSLAFEGALLEATAVGAPGTVWRAMDDLMACLAVALGVEEATDALDETARYE